MPIFESCVFGSRKWLYHALFTDTMGKNVFETSLQVGLHALAKGKETGKGLNTQEDHLIRAEGKQEDYRISICILCVL